MKKHFWDKSCHYSIRKLTVGTASVCWELFSSQPTVAADSVGGQAKLNQPLSKLSLSLIVNPKQLKRLKLQIRL